MPFGCFNHGAGTSAMSPKAVPPKLATTARPLDRARVVSAAGEGTEADGDDIGGLIQRRMLDLFAEVERQMIRARTKAALAEKKRKGERVSGGIPYGYRLASDGIHLEPCEREQEVIALVASLRADGASYRAIVATLNGNGIPPRSGKAWHLAQIQRIIATAATATN